MNDPKEELNLKNSSITERKFQAHSAVVGLTCLHPLLLSI